MGSGGLGGSYWRYAMCDVHFVISSLPLHSSWLARIDAVLVIGFIACISIDPIVLPQKDRNASWARHRLLKFTFKILCSVSMLHGSSAVTKSKSHVDKTEQLSTRAQEVVATK